MELDNSWAAIFDIWENPAGRCSHLSGYANLELYTPPRSPPDPPKQETSNEVESDEEIEQLCTPISKIFESPHYDTYKGDPQTIRITTTYPFTPEDSPLRLVARRTPPDSNVLQISEAGDCDQKLPAHFQDKSSQNYQTMGHQTRKDSLVEDRLPDPALTGGANSSSSHNGRQIPSWPAADPAPRPTGPFLSSSRIQYCRPLSGSKRRDAQRINRELIRCCANLAMDNPVSLDFADNALAMAEEAGIYYLVSKSQLYRGMCLMESKRWKEASFAFTGAASVRDWEGKAWELKNMAESNLLQESRRKRKPGVEIVEDDAGTIVIDNISLHPQRPLRQRQRYKTVRFAAQRALVAMFHRFIHSKSRHRDANET
jgi:hypothetical protein